MATCKRCNGTRWFPFTLGGISQCPDCKGTGETDDDEHRCQRCGERAGFFHICPDRRTPRP